MKIFLKIKKGATIRRPDNGTLLTESGAWVVKTPFWIRQINSGDVIDATPGVEVVKKEIIEEKIELKDLEKKSVLSKKELKKTEPKSGGDK